MPSFGDGARLDYGTGHELNFVAFLCCLEAHKIFTIDQRTNVIHSIFKRYIAVTRRIQQHFRCVLLTQDATGETLSLPPESTRTLMDICEDIMLGIREAKFNEKET